MDPSAWTALYWNDEITACKVNSLPIVREIAAQVVQTLKAQCSGDILVYGSGELSRLLLASGPVNGLNPVVLGQGKRFFGGHSGPPLTVTASPAFSSRMLLLQYQPLDAA